VEKYYRKNEELIRRIKNTEIQPMRAEIIIVHLNRKKICRDDISSAPFLVIRRG